MAPKRQRRVVATLVKTTRKVVEETLQVSVEGGEGNGEQNHSKESKVVEVDVEEMKAQLSPKLGSPPWTTAKLMRKQRRRRPTGERKRVKKLPKREQRNLLRGIDEKQEKEGRGEDKEEAPKGEGKQRKEGVAVEGEEKGKKRGRGGKRRRRSKRYGGGVEGVGGGYKRPVCVQGGEAGAPRDGGVVEGDGGARRHDDRHDREAGGRGGTAVQVRRKGDPVIKRDPGCGAAWGARQACHLSGDESCVQLC